MSDLTDKQAAQTIKIVGADTVGVENNYADVDVNQNLYVNLGAADFVGQQQMTGSIPTVIASDQSPIDAGVVLGDQYTPNIPDTGTTQTRLLTDPDNQLKIRGDVLTDEGTFRDDFSGVALGAAWTSTQTGDASLTVASSFVNIISGTQNGNTSLIKTTGDYGPIVLRMQFTLSQRIANQTTDVGFKDVWSPTNFSAFFRFTGTSNTSIQCVSQSSTNASDIQTTTATYPAGFTSATPCDYYIEVQPDQVTFLLNGIQIAQHKLHIPGPYDSLDVYAGITNQAVVTSTTLSIDYIYLVNQNSLQVNNTFDGDALPIRVKTGVVQTYGAAIAGFAYAANGTDIFTISGSATKTIRIKHISVDGTQTNTSSRTVLLVKRSSANTGGTSVVLTNVPYDSSNQPATAVVRYYTANPTALGTSVGSFHNEKLIVGAANSADSDALVFSTLDSSSSQDITLRGVNEFLCINMNGVTSTGNSMNIDIMWTEE